MTKDRGGARGLAAPTSARLGGALRLGPGGKVVWPLRRQDGTGKLELWVWEDAAVASNPKRHAAGAMWGLLQADGHTLTVGAIYAPYLAGATTYATAAFNPAKEQQPWQEVQYLGIKRTPGWHKWTFDFDPDQGMRLLYDDKEAKFNWNQSRLNGFTSVVLFGDATDAKQVLWVDDVSVTLGPAAKLATLWPPPPPGVPGELTVLPPQAPWDPTPYARWQRGPGKSEDYFPIAVWLQEPKLASRYKAAGINLYLALYKGPTQEQFADLRAAGMPVICDQNDYARAHLDDQTIVAWMQPDEPDNAQSFKGFWKEDVEKLNVAWPELFRTLGPNRPYRGYGPAIPPKWIIRDYEKAKAADPTRPMFLGMGQGVAWEKYIGRGERTGHLEDYAEYMKGCDIAAFDIYPAAAGNLEVKDALWYVPLGIRRLRERCGDHKPAWAHIETGIISSPSAKPAPLQVKAEVWMAIIHGTQGHRLFRAPVQAEVQRARAVGRSGNVGHGYVGQPADQGAGAGAEQSDGRRRRRRGFVQCQDAGACAGQTAGRGHVCVQRGDVRRADHGDVPLAGSGGDAGGPGARGRPRGSHCRRRVHGYLRRKWRAFVSHCGVASGPGGSRAQGLPLEARGAALQLVKIGAKVIRQSKYVTFQYETSRLTMRCAIMCVVRKMCAASFFVLGLGSLSARSGFAAQYETLEVKPAVSLAGDFAGLSLRRRRQMPRRAAGRPRRAAGRVGVADRVPAGAQRAVSRESVGAIGGQARAGREGRADRRGRTAGRLSSGTCALGRLDRTSAHWPTAATCGHDPPFTTAKATAPTRSATASSWMPRSWPSS